MYISTLLGQTQSRPSKRAGPHLRVCALVTSFIDAKGVSDPMRFVDPLFPVSAGLSVFPLSLVKNQSMIQLCLMCLIFAPWSLLLFCLVLLIYILDLLPLLVILQLVCHIFYTHKEKSFSWCQASSSIAAGLPEPLFLTLFSGCWFLLKVV